MNFCWPAPSHRLSTWCGPLADAASGCTDACAYGTDGPGLRLCGAAASRNAGAGAVLSEIGGDHAPGRLSSYAGGVSGGGGMIYFDARGNHPGEACRRGPGHGSGDARYEFPGAGELSRLPPGGGNGLSVPPGGGGAAGRSAAGKRHHHHKRHPWTEHCHSVAAGVRGPGGDFRI